MDSAIQFVLTTVTGLHTSRPIGLLFEQAHSFVAYHFNTRYLYK